MKLLLVLLAAVGVAVAQQITTHSSDGSVFVSSGSVNGDKYFGQWTFGDLTCYIARETNNGISNVVKQCRRGLLGMYHPMTMEEEQIMEVQIRKAEEEKMRMKETLAENNAVLQNNMRSMNNQIQRNMQNMQTQMQDMQRMMRQQMQNAFAAFG